MVPHARATPAPRLALVGGRLERDNEALFRALGERCPGTMLVLSMASGYPDEVGAELVEDFRDHGIDAEHLPLYHENREQSAFDPALVARLRSAGGVFFSGGDQARIVATLVQGGVETPALEAIRAFNAAGGLVAGTSAGAAMQSRHMILGGTSLHAVSRGVDAGGDGLQLGAGLGFFRHGIVDQHFLQRGRIGRLAVAAQHCGEELAFGVDENTALFVDGDEALVLGETGVVVLDLRSVRAEADGALRDIRLSYLDSGDRFDLAGRRALPAPDKRRVRVTRASFRRPAPVRRHAFGAYAVHDLLLRLIEGDPAFYRRDDASAVDTAYANRVRVELERLPRRSRALRARRNGEIRYSGLDFRLHLSRIALATPVTLSETTTVLRPDPSPDARLVLLGSAPMGWGAAGTAQLLEHLRAPVGVLATASGEPDAMARRYLDWLAEQGLAAELIDVSLSNIERAGRDRALLARMGNMGSLLFTGGDQRRLTETLLHCAEATPVLHAVVSAYEHGTPLLAVGAAASALADRMIAGGDSEDALRDGSSGDAGAEGIVVERGIGLLGHGLVDQNFLERHRLGRLLVACVAQRVRYGFGLCEGSGIVLHGGERVLRAFGDRGLVVAQLDPARARLGRNDWSPDGITLRVLEPGQAFHLDTAAGDSGHPSAEGGALLERVIADLASDLAAVRPGPTPGHDAAALVAALRGNPVH
jgi:cyanophycinase